MNCVLYALTDDDSVKTNTYKVGISYDTNGSEKRLKDFDKGFTPIWFAAMWRVENAYTACDKDVHRYFRGHKVRRGNHEWLVGVTLDQINEAIKFLFGDHNVKRIH
jgi:hypothetical protein